MDTSEVQSVADHKIDAKADGVTLPAHLQGLPDDTHIITGKIVGNGATELASPLAQLSAKVIKLTRSDDGGIEYQVAILVNEPKPNPVPVPAPPVDANTENAVAYLKTKGMTDEQAREKVKLFGWQRVLAAKDKELDQEVQALIQGSPSAPPPVQPKSMPVLDESLAKKGFTPAQIAAVKK